jgi:hypothetical protein
MLGTKGFLMSDDTSKLPHFLRVARSVASAHGTRRIALPLAAAAATAALGLACGGNVTSSSEGAGTTGSGGASASSSQAGYGAGFTTMPTGTGGYDGGAVGDMVMPDGGPVGIMVMPDGGLDAGH